MTHMSPQAGQHDLPEKGRKVMVLTTMTFLLATMDLTTNTVTQNRL